jgi:hypothetical protein
MDEEGLLLIKIVLVILLIALVVFGVACIQPVTTLHHRYEINTCLGRINDPHPLVCATQTAEALPWWQKIGH